MPRGWRGWSTTCKACVHLLHRRYPTPVHQLSLLTPPHQWPCPARTRPQAPGCIPCPAWVWPGAQHPQPAPPGRERTPEAGAGGDMWAWVLCALHTHSPTMMLCQLASACSELPARAELCICRCQCCAYALASVVTILPSPPGTAPAPGRTGRAQQWQRGRCRQSGLHRGVASVEWIA